MAGPERRSREPALLDVRRLAALDMYGSRGTRRRLILGEFVLGFAGLLAVGGTALHSASTALSTLFGLWLIGAGINYLPLVLHAISLMGRDALETELAGVDTQRDLRRYGLKQLWLLVPCIVLVLAVVQIAREQGTGVRRR